MIYRSNIIAPDLEPAFAPHLLVKPRDCAYGHSVPSDRDYDPDCGFFTHDEAAILWACASQVKGYWLDIGARTGWTSAHIAKAGATVTAIDQAYIDDEIRSRAMRNMASSGCDGNAILIAKTSEEFFCDWRVSVGSYYDGICIDGNHDAPVPLDDADGAQYCLKDTGVIIMHDFWGGPIQDAVNFLIAAGLQCRVYNTPNGLAVCWRGDFTPPDHVPDPAINWAKERKARAPRFDFSRCV